MLAICDASKVASAGPTASFLQLSPQKKRFRLLRSIADPRNDEVDTSLLTCALGDLGFDLFLLFHIVTVLSEDPAGPIDLLKATSTGAAENCAVLRPQRHRLTRAGVLGRLPYTAMAAGGMIQSRYADLEGLRAPKSGSDTSAASTTHHRNEEVVVREFLPHAIFSPLFSFFIDERKTHTSLPLARAFGKQLQHLMY
ncbi:hypothetical protein EI94DRAFT_861529 [Lactarius quietus]|nr:hypothetical protein EI94DRAFT_861529 [Lactarius quietus]